MFEATPTSFQAREAQLSHRAGLSPSRQDRERGVTGGGGRTGDGPQAGSA